MKTDFRPETWGGDNTRKQQTKQSLGDRIRAEEGRVYPNRKHLGLIQSNEKYNSVLFCFCFFVLFFSLKVGRRPILAYIIHLPIVNDCKCNLIRVYTDAKTGNSVMALLVYTTGSAMWSESHMFEMGCLFSALDNNVFHFNPNNNSLTKKHIISFITLLYTFLKLPGTRQGTCQHKMKRIWFFGPPM